MSAGGFQFMKTSKSPVIFIQFSQLITRCNSNSNLQVMNDSQLFELLAMSGMLMDYNWTEILKRKELLR